jgi:predicted ATPase/class 3 adenylate cyclase
MDIEKWLCGLGLQQYVTVFRDNAIDAEVLAELTEADLEKLGVVLGHRKRLLKAIATLASPSALEQATAVGSAPSLGGEAERRQLTVMFCDLVGSTQLSARMDPEDLRDVVGAYQRYVAKTVSQFGGFVAKYMGDGVLVYFGYPQAHEDDAERAVRAGLKLTKKIAALKPNSSVNLQVRIGIATGLAVVGDLVGSGASREQAVVGETPNLAARLQAIAEPNTVVIADSTHVLLGSLFECHDLGLVQMKGFVEPIQPWQVLRASAVESRFEALHPAALSPLIGRDEEISLLLRRWEQAKSGEGRSVLLSGEPGIGKSRLTVALHEKLQGEPHIRLRYFCSPYHADSALHPFIAQIERAAAFEHDETREAKLDKLEALPAAASSSREDMALLAELLSIPTDGRFAPTELSPQRKKERTLEALLRQFECLARQAPLLMIFEDLHWIDPTSRELLDLLVDRMRRLPVLLLATFRPEFDPPWVGQSHVTLIALSRLGTAEARALVGRIVGNNPSLSPETLDEIVARTDGVPLFVEELTNAVLEAGIATEDGRGTLSKAPQSLLGVPSTLQASLMARLDRLGSAREIAQIGAVIGREFSYELLAAVAPLREAELQDVLHKLAASGLVFQRGAPPDAAYMFKHGLVQDAAYGTLLKRRRQELHSHIARVYEDRFPTQTELQPEMMARHCTEAGLTGKAIDYWDKAGQRAARSGAMAEAIADFTKALGLLAGFAEGPQRDRRELALRLALARILLMAKGWASPEMGDAYLRARELSRRVGEKPEVVAALIGLYALRTNRAEIASANDVGDELFCLAEQRYRSDRTVKMLGHRITANGLMFQADFAASLMHYHSALDLYDPVAQRGEGITPTDSRVLIRGFIGWILLFQGYADRALRESEQALCEAREYPQSYTLAFALHVNCLFRQVRDDRQELSDRSAELVALATEQGFPHFLATGTFFRGWARFAAGEATDDAVSEMQRGLAAKQATGAEIKVPYYLGLLAAAHMQRGRAPEALRLLAEAFARVERTGERWFEAELNRIHGEVLIALSRDRADDAEAAFRHGLAIAQAQGAKWWEHRTAASLARLWRDQGKRKQACDLLAPIYGWFSEGFDTRDLKEAKALLDELAR